MVVQAYILIQTDVGKAAEVATGHRPGQGRHPRRGRHRSLRRDRARRGPQRRRARQAGRREGAEPRRHHPHADLPGRAHLTSLTHCTPTAPRVRPDTGRRRRRPPCACAARPVRRASPTTVADRLPRRHRGRARPALPRPARRPARHGRRRAAARRSTPDDALRRRLGRPGDRADLRRDRCRRASTGSPTCQVANGVGWYVPEDAGRRPVAWTSR